MPIEKYETNIVFAGYEEYWNALKEIRHELKVRERNWSLKEQEKFTGQLVLREEYNTTIGSDEKMKLNYKDWNEHDKAPAKTRYVKNSIELSEKRLLNTIERCKKETKREMAIPIVLSIVISVINSLFMFRHVLFLKRVRGFLLKRW